MLHDWLEGVLADHLRFFWGFQDTAKENYRALKEKTHRKKQQCLDNGKEAEVGSGSSSFKFEDDIELCQGISGGLFKTEKIKLFWYILEDIKLPSGSGKLPKNLGPQDMVGSRKQTG
ncbi:hypothetical protein O181_060789 [Austropuccinia psidii MF-1]|uniref:Uncharacterized protein n=1 Tax=Austropuccinia psidii MF-1 TaxID=1389203 RepID=A0A9Q3EH11_9BASI|nr:hypothetical protein [Austropuccinia psidii MF-1]